LEKFKSDAGCRVFLSTDAGGTGLNLQVADTVVNIELPWNPAVLEQRIARVHRMGQKRPVRAINLVTRGTIEEKILRTLEAKQALFAGIFEGDVDEIPFEASHNSGFLDSMRELLNEQQPVVPEASTIIKSSLQTNGLETPLGNGTCSPVSDTIWLGVAQLLEAANVALSDKKSIEQLSLNLREKILAAANELSNRLKEKRTD
jgi:superfamily II DNA/RNA helicase